MKIGVSALERAFELASSGRVAGVAGIKKALKGEGYSVAELEGRVLSNQLRNIIKSAFEKAKPQTVLDSDQNAYDVRFTGGFVHFVAASSRQAAAEIALSGNTTPHPPTGDPSQPAACYVKEHGGSVAKTPFWRASETGEPDAIPAEDLNAINDE